MANVVLPYSYHTFLFPFIWKTSSLISKKDFYDKLDIGNAWTECVWKDMMDVDKYQQESKEWFQNYQAYQYFTDAANNAVFNTRGDNVVQCYECHNHDGYYIIYKKDKTYRLKINRIRLNVYDAGIAILVFELENSDDNQKSLEAVNAINEHGRRINMPFLVKPNDEGEVAHTLLADKIALEFNGKEVTEEYFREQFKHIHENIRTKKISLSGVMKPILYLLDGGKEVHRFTANPKDRDKFYIKPATDDRMFVCCMVMDQELSKELQGKGNRDLSYLSDVEIRLPAPNARGKVIDCKGKPHDDYMAYWSDEETLSSRLYKYLYVENDLSCEDNSMKKELLRASVYNRWINRGTIYGVTHHSFMCINNGSPAIIDSVINPFLTLYVQMTILVLAQRAVILLLEDEASEVANGFSGNLQISKEDLKRIETLQVKYVKVQNQLLLSEITVQEQGVELYEMLTKQLYIKENVSDLNTEINNLRDISKLANDRIERKSDEREEKQFNILGVMLGLLALVEPLAMWLVMTGEEKQEGSLWFTLSIVVFAVIVSIYLFIKRRGNADQDNN